MRGVGATLTLAGLLLAASAAPAQTTWRVAAEGPLASIGQALERAAPGDTVRVGPGVYRERLVVEKPVVLVGIGGPVVDAGGDGHVIEALAPIEIRGFILRASGTSVDEESAGVMVRDARAVVEGNRIEDVLYGVYLKNAPGSVVARNRIRGKPFDPPRRGDGIRLWYSSGARIEGNLVDRTRDVVVYFSDSLTARDNRITNGRYGLHYMYSDHSRLEGNRLSGNHVGAFLMYSEDIDLVGNVFHEAEGASGMGLGLKDADRVLVEGNLFLENAVGIHLDNAPRSRDAANRFRGNALVRNGSGVRVLPSVAGNEFADNDFLGNERAVEVAGGMSSGVERQNDWTGNHWDDYAGFDRDGDGIGDGPYVYARLADALLAVHPRLRLFARSPALELLDLMARFFPFLRPEPVVVDPSPRLEAVAIGAWTGERIGGALPGRLARVGWAGAWAALALGAIALLRRGGRSR